MAHSVRVTTVCAVVHLMRALRLVGPIVRSRLWGRPSGKHTCYDQARAVSSGGREPSAEEIEHIRSQITDDFIHQSSAYYATSEIWDDGIIDPVATRNALGMSIAASLNAPIADGRYGVLRL